MGAPTTSKDDTSMVPEADYAPKAENAASATSDGPPRQDDDDDPHDIQDRFVNNHRRDFPKALREINNGKKETCWLWYILPAAPYIVNGVEKGSAMNRKFALRGDDAVEAFLTFENDQGVDLRQNYIDMATAIYKQMKKKGKSLRDLLGDLDDAKAVSSFELFARIAEQRMEDSELALICRQVLELAQKHAKKRARNSRTKQLSGLKNLFGLKNKQSNSNNKPQRHTWHY